MKWRRAAQHGDWLSRLRGKRGRIRCLMAFQESVGSDYTSATGQYLSLPCVGTESTLRGGSSKGGNGRLQFNGISAYRVGSSRVRTLNDVPEVPALILRILGRVYDRRDRPTDRPTLAESWLPAQGGGLWLCGASARYNCGSWKRARARTIRAFR